jgi:hypothetical protein
MSSQHTRCSGRRTAMLNPSLNLTRYAARLRGQASSNVRTALGRSCAHEVRLREGNSARCEGVLNLTDEAVGRNSSADAERGQS